MNRHSVIYLSLILSFILGVHGGKIALWTDSSPDPSVVFPLPVELLPEKDQKLLREGITVQSQEELARLLEDYLS